VSTTDSNRDLPVFPNLYRNIIPAKPDTVWVGDIMYIRIATGFCYLGAILDATNDERAAVRQTLEKMIRERAGDSGAATLTNPVHIGIGTK
jgi:putative transposase